MAKWKVKEFVPVVPSAFIWAVVPEDDEWKVTCLAPTKEKAESIVREHNYNEKTFYRLTEDNLQTVAKQRLGRLLTPEELKSAAKAASSLDIPWDEYLDRVLECENLNAGVRCMHCTHPEGAHCQMDQRTECDCVPCKFCTLYPNKEASPETAE